MIKKFIQYLFNLLGYKLSRIDTSFVFPIEISKENRKIIKDCNEFTMTGSHRMYALVKCLENVVENNIDGDFVECGVWRGGNLILSQKIFDKLSLNKKVYGYDTFSGMTEPSSYDRDLRLNYAETMMKKTNKIDNKKNIWAFVSKEKVFLNISKFFTKHNIKLIEGDVRQTLLVNENLPSKISILRLDTDWYDSTKIELEILFPLLQKNGFLIIDDYGHFMGAKRAVDEYFKKKNIKPYLHIVDYSCRIFIKQ